MTSGLGLLIRADGDARIGAGHVMRLLALAAGARGRGGLVMLASVSLVPALAARAEREGVTVLTGVARPGSREDAEWLAGLARGAGARWVAIDGDAFDASYQDVLRTAGLSVVMVDDFGRNGPYAADVIVNQNVFASAALYERRLDETRLLLGPTYALLRPDFSDARMARQARPRATGVLVTLGGADPAGLTRHVVAALARLRDPDLRFTVIVGAAATLGAAELEAIDRRCVVMTAVEEMASVMTAADLAITGAGTTVYELCALGVPPMVVPIVPGQRTVSAALAAADVAVDLGGHGPADDPEGFARAVDRLLRDERERDALSRRGQALVDGLGARRVLDVMR